ncbi:MAG: hypothetical protein IKK11_08870 [Oscillospiraceae bacterium]|nr:hypothetical protein [Oscillospiraceae bacterium]
MERISKVRASIVLLVFAIILGFFSLKLYDLQIIETGGSTNNQATFTTLTRVKAARGDILDKNGNLLVSNRASYDLNINHYVLLTAKGTNDNLLRLVKRCEEVGIAYTEHFPVSQERPFTYTLDQQNAIWQGYFQEFLNYMEDLDSDITAPLLVEKLRDKYDIPAEWTDDEARKVIGLLYEMTLRKCVSSLPIYVFLTDASDAELSAIVELNIPGMKVEASTVREYNTVYAAHILGYVGAMNAEQWEYYKNIPGYDMDAQVGQDGLEAVYEEFLHGIDGWREDTVTTDGTLVSSKFRQEPKAGSNVEVSIDLNIQMAGEDRMAQVIEDLKKPDANGKLKDGHDAEGGAFVAMDVKTGQLLACGSYPTYDLNNFFDNYEELAKNELKPLYNRALLATYPPGSTYKMTTMIAAMNAKLIDSETVIRDQGVFQKIPNFPVSCLQWTNYGGTHGNVNAAKSLMVSCNYYYYELGYRLYNYSTDYMDEVAKGLGLGERTGVELPEYIGHRANAETKAEIHVGDDKAWYQGDSVLAAIGQSENRFTPIQLCSYAATLANRGNRYKATFMSRVVSSDYRELLDENKPELLSHMDISDEAYKTYKEGMYMVTQATSADWGTAYSTFGNYPIKIAAKTGTAETGINGTSANGAFICFAPLDDPQIAIAVYVEKGGHGSTLASIAKSMLDVYFDVGEVGDVNSFENQIS